MRTTEDRGLRLVTSADAAMAHDFELALELSTNRLREAVAILRVINDGDILAEIQTDDTGAHREHVASLLAVLARELDAVVSAQDDLLQGPRPAAAQIE